MGSWSNLCAIHFTKRINAWLRTGFPVELATKPPWLNVYYVNPCIANDRSTRFQQRFLKLLHRTVHPDHILVYNLLRGQFEAGLWETSARLLVLVDDLEHKREGLVRKDFKLELELVSRFLAGGGRVLLLLHSPSSSNNKNHESTTFGSLLSTGSIPSTEMEQQKATSWSWAMNTTDQSTQKPTERFLLGSTSGVAPTVEPLVGMVVSWMDVLLSDADSLHAALSLLQIPCLPSHQANGIVPNVESELLTEQADSSSIVHFHCLVQADGKKTMLPDLLFPSGNHLGGDQECRIAVSSHRYTGNGHTAIHHILPGLFNWSAYLATLRTRVLGRTLMWTESLESSWDLCEQVLPKLPSNSGLLVLSNRQTKAKARGENLWITPLGQAAFTFHVTMTKMNAHSLFMNHVTCLQHVTALSCLLACKQIIAERYNLWHAPSAEESFMDEESLLNLQLPGPQIRLKWPNDILVVDDATVNGQRSSILGKLAGILTKCSMSGPDQVDCLIGIGLNVANQKPTICLQDLLDRAVEADTTRISVAEVVAAVLTRLERLLDRSLSEPNGLDWVLGLYTRCWIHSNQVLDVRSASITDRVDDVIETRKCMILGLDAFGYLQVRDQLTERVLSVHPDGNSMDMLRGLIFPKERT